MHVAILGGGVVGVSLSYHLIKAGFKVTLIEKEQDVALGTSFANGGQLSYSHVLPMKKREILASYFNAALSMPLGILVKDFPWLSSFLAYSSKKQNISKAYALMYLANESKNELNEILGGHKINFSYQQKGTIHILGEEVFDEGKVYQKLGVDFQYLTKDELIKKEPLLRNSKFAKAGIFFPNDASGDAQSFSKEIFHILQKSPNFTLQANSEILKINMNNGKIKSVVTTGSEISADQFILCFVPQCNLFHDVFDLSKLVKPVSGYSYSLKGNKLNHAVTYPKKRIVFSQFENVTRMAGCLDYVGYDKVVRQSRADFFRSAVLDIFPEFEIDVKPELWKGVRMVSKDFLPIIGPSQKIENLYFNMAHATLGWTLSQGSAKIIANLLTNVKQNEYIDAFSAQRFRI